MRAALIEMIAIRFDHPRRGRPAESDRRRDVIATSVRSCIPANTSTQDRLGVGSETRIAHWCWIFTPVRAIVPLIDALYAAGIAGAVRPACPRCRRVVGIDRPLIKISLFTTGELKPDLIDCKHYSCTINVLIYCTTGADMRDLQHRHRSTVSVAFMLHRRSNLLSWQLVLPCHLLVVCVLLLAAPGGR
jgi:hypothetical protein